LNREAAREAMRVRLALLLLVLLAFALRLYHLAYVELRGDEAFDVLYAAQSPGEVIHQDLCCQVYPPLHHVSLHYWLLLAGASEFSYRLLYGVVPGVLLVPLCFRLAAELLGEKAGLRAALLAALSPYLIWWSQDGHFYSGLACASAAIMWLGARSLRTGRRRELVPYVLTTALALLMHYFSCFAWGAVNLLALVRLARRKLGSHEFWRWCAAQVVAILIISPWLVPAIGPFLGYDLGWARPVTPWDMLSRIFRAYSLGMAGWPGQNWLLLGFLLLLIVAVLPARWLPRGEASLAAVGEAAMLLAAPLAVFWIGSLRRPMFDDKFTVFALPVYLALLGYGLARLRGRPALQALALALLLGPSAVALGHYYWDQRTYKSPGWRQAMAVVQSQALPGDALIYNLPEPAAMYYNASRLPIYLLPSQAGMPTAAAEAEVADLAGRYSRLWLMPMPRPEWDGQAVVQQWLERHAERAVDLHLRGLRLESFVTLRTLMPELSQVDARFGPEPGSGWTAALAGYRVVWADARTLRLTLVWQSAGPSAIPYKVFVHLVGSDGQIRAQQDNPPVQGTYPTNQWQVGELIVDQYRLEFPPAARAGNYELRLGLYQGETGLRLPVSGSDGHGDYVLLPERLTYQGGG